MKQTVERSARVLNYLGLVLIVCGSAFFLAIVALRLPAIHWSRSYYWAAHVRFALLGCVILGVGSFVMYLFDSDCKQSWMLRHIDLFIYLYAAMIILQSVVTFPMAAMKELLHHRGIYVFLQSLFLSYVPAIARTCVLLGIGKIAKITLSIIHESRTLV